MIIEPLSLRGPVATGRLACLAGWVESSRPTGVTRRWWASLRSTHPTRRHRPGDLCPGSTGPAHHRPGAVRVDSAHDVEGGQGVVEVAPHLAVAGDHFLE